MTAASELQEIMNRPGFGSGRAYLDRKAQEKEAVALLPDRKRMAPVMASTNLDNWMICIFNFDDDQFRRHAPMLCPYAPGDRLYVREAHKLIDRHCDYRADWPEENQRFFNWRPSIHMPRWASRLTLTVTDVLVQRLQDISAADSIAEGVECETCAAMGQSACHGRGCFASIDAYRTLWNSLHGPAAWDANPWCVAVSFTVQHGNIDRLGGRND